MNFNLIEIRAIYFTLLFLGITQHTCGQNINIVIQVNEELIVSEIGGIYLSFENVKGIIYRSSIGYIPDELTLQDEDWKKIHSDSIKRIILHFDFYNYQNNKYQSKTFEVEMEKYHFDKSYLILQVYDFRDRKYRKRYGCLTSQDYITEFNFPQGGILLGCQ